jgi:DNA-directed RNA polymerase subunit RPC12/RpoP
MCQSPVNYYRRTLQGDNTMANTVIEVKCPKCNSSIRAEAQVLTSSNAKFGLQPAYQCLKCKEQATVTFIEPQKEKE